VVVRDHRSRAGGPAAAARADELSVRGLDQRLALPGEDLSTQAHGEPGLARCRRQGQRPLLLPAGSGEPLDLARLEDVELVHHLR
jgi:hypothetical protein